MIETLGASALAVSLLVAPGLAAAQSDVDGAVEALIDFPLNTFGDLGGATGLVLGGLGGVMGDIVALVDDNPYLRGILSTTIHRLSLGVSNSMTGMLEGLRAEDLERYPEPASAYLDNDDPGARIDNVLDGVGGTYVALSDAIGNPLLVILRAAGVQDRAERISTWQEQVRDRYFGPVRGN
ncbi:MAG: hypothetical protein ACE5FG_12295 [Myxococcota bacterium]